MAHPELQLISRIVRSGELAQVLEWGITQDDFNTTEGRGFFTVLKGFHNSPESRGSVPGPNVMKDKYPSFDLCDDPSMTLDALCAAVREQRIIKDIEKLTRDSIDELYSSPLSVASKLAAKAQEINALGMKRIDEQLLSGITNVVSRYDKVESGIDASQITWPWEPFQAATQGVQEDDYIVFYGRPKSMKSFALAKWVAHSYEEGKHVLVYTKEMPAWQVFRRVAACIARLPYDELRLGKLKPEHRRALMLLEQEVIEEHKRTGGKHTITVLSGKDAPAGTDNMSWLKGKVMKYKPDVVFIDGLYLMSSETRVGKENERVAQISRSCRQMVLDTKVPVIATMQANRAAAKHDKGELDEIAFSDAIGQDATCVIRVINERDAPTLALVVAGSREFKLHAVRIWGIPCTNFSFKEEMSEKEIKKAQTDDAKAEEGEKASTQVRKPITEKNKEATAQSKAMQDQLNRM